MTLSNAISTVASKVANYLTGNVDAELLCAEIGFQSSELNLSFENEDAWINFKNAVKHELFIEFNSFYRGVFPLAQMDENGEYTYNSDSWV